MYRSVTKPRIRGSPQQSSTLKHPRTLPQIENLDHISTWLIPIVAAGPVLVSYIVAVWAMDNSQQYEIRCHCKESHYSPDDPDLNKW